MRIAILGWGSLLWDPGSLPMSGEWQQDGPVLPVEFSRISDEGALTLVIDERHGVGVPTQYALSPGPSIDEAVIDLHRHEGCPPKKIGFLEVATDRISPRARERHPNACECIKAWAAEHGFDAVVWTALSPRFRCWIDAPFSPRRLRQLLAEPARLAEGDGPRVPPPGTGGSDDTCAPGGDPSRIDRSER